MLGTSPKKIQRWYQQVLSGFVEAKQEGKLFKHDIKSTHSAPNIRVPIVLMKNYGPNLAIDEKHIRGRYYTILSNQDTGKIILLIKSVKSQEVYKVIRKYFTSEQMVGVRNITKDAAGSFDWVARQAFLNATKILDKFHVLKWAFDALQNLRIEIKNQYLIDLHEKEKKLNHKYKQDLRLAKRQGIKLAKSEYTLKPEIHLNGETTKQLLSRSRFLLYKITDDWNDEQEKRATILFDLFPKLFKAYVCVLNFRSWYSKDDIGTLRNFKELKLMTWLEDVSKIKSNAFKTLKNTISKNRGQILNYFIEGKSNASAEALNRNIQKFIGVNYGIRNINYFFFRLNILHHSTSI